MSSPGWLTRSLADVPAADGWLSPRERETLADLHVPKRRADWRLGRWAAKAAICAWIGAPPASVEVVAAASGAPEALVGGERAPEALSLSHRGGRALAVVADAGVAIGCDLEVAEPRSEAFLSTWLAPAERASVETAGSAGRSRLANVLWTAKEAAAKACREGLRVDVRGALVELEWKPWVDREWRPLSVHWDGEGVTAHGWWREEKGWAFAFVSDPPTPAPIPL